MNGLRRFWRWATFENWRFVLDLAFKIGAAVFAVGIYAAVTRADVASGATCADKIDPAELSQQYGGGGVPRAVQVIADSYNYGRGGLRSGGGFYPTELFACGPSVEYDELQPVVDSIDGSFILVDHPGYVDLVVDSRQLSTAAQAEAIHALNRSRVFVVTVSINNSGRATAHEVTVGGLGNSFKPVDPAPDDLSPGQRATAVYESTPGMSSEFDTTSVGVTWQSDEAVNWPLLVLFWIVAVAVLEVPFVIREIRHEQTDPPPRVDRSSK